MATARLTFEARADLFTRLWGLALLAHVVGNQGLADLPELAGFTNLVVGLLGLGLILNPQRRLLVAASMAVILSALAETPRLGNHWLVAGLVSVAILVSAGRPERFAPAARWILLIFYSFAAFAKLNQGFFDPEVSCAVFYADQWLDGWGLPALGGSSGVAPLLIWSTVLIELAVPVLLMTRKTRALGVMVGTIFHTVISYDLNQHFYDFTASLLPLFFLFLPESSASQVERRIEAVPPMLRRVVTRVVAVVGSLLVVGAVLPPDGTMPRLVGAVALVLWIPFSLWWLFVLGRSLATGERLSFALNWVLVLVVLATFLNGLTPYTEVKTAFGFNMYANLLTAGGDSNHLLITRTLPLRKGYRRPVEIVESSDPGLEEYARREYLIAYPEFRNYLIDHPEVSVTYTRGGVTFVIGRAGDSPAFSTPQPWWSRYLPLRSIDQMRPPRCQDVFLPAQ